MLPDKAHFGQRRLFWRAAFRREALLQPAHQIGQAQQGLRILAQAVRNRRFRPQLVATQLRTASSSVAVRALSRLAWHSVLSPEPHSSTEPRIPGMVTPNAVGSLHDFDAQHVSIAG